jgi:hypothetical protein
MEVGGDHGDHAGNQRRTHHAGFFALSGLPRGTSEAGLRRGQGGVSGRREGAGNGLVETIGQKRAAQADSAAAVGQLADRSGEGWKRVGEAVVAVDAGDLFDEIDFALQVEPPAGEGRLATSRSIRRPVRSREP